MEHDGLRKSLRREQEREEEQERETKCRRPNVEWKIYGKLQARLRLSTFGDPPSHLTDIENEPPKYSSSLARFLAIE